MTESSPWRAVKTGHYVADHTGVESAYGAFLLKCSFAAVFVRVCAAFVILAEWSTETITLVVLRQHELSWILKLRTISESVCIVSLIMYVGGKVLSGKRLVGDTIYRGKVLCGKRQGNVLSGKHLVTLLLHRFSEVFISTSPGNIWVIVVIIF